MNTSIFINDSLENRISYYLLSCFLIALPYAHFYSEILLTCFSVHVLIHASKERLSALKNRTVWVITSVFFLNLMTISYSNYVSEGFKEVDHQLGILLFPVCLSLANIQWSNYKVRLLKIFAFTCTCTIVYLYFHAFGVIYYFRLPWSSILRGSFINQHFSEPIGLHATYLSMYAALSVSIYIYLLSGSQGVNNWIYIFFTAILLAGLIQLSSRAVVVSLCMIVMIAVPLMLLKGKKRVYFSLTSLLAFLIIAFSVSNSGSLKKRYVQDLENDLSMDAVTPDLTETRMKRWDLEIGVILKSPLAGYGGGSEKYILKDQYYKKKFYRSYLLELNAHNQYLSFLIKTGVIGLLLYFYILFYGFSAARKRRDFLLVSFLIIIATVSFSENILDVNKGIFFYSFFFSFFLLTDPEE